MITSGSFNKQSRGRKTSGTTSFKLDSNFNYSRITVKMATLCVRVNVQSEYWKEKENWTHGWWVQMWTFPIVREVNIWLNGAVFWRVAEIAVLTDEKDSCCSGVLEIITFAGCSSTLSSWPSAVVQRTSLHLWSCFTDGSFVGWIRCGDQILP